MIRMAVALLAGLVGLSVLTGEEAGTRLGGLEPKGFRISSYPPSEQPPAGTVAHWRFAGMPGTVASEEATVAEASGRFPALAFGGPMHRVVDGRPGLEFNGGNDRVFVKDDPAFALTGSLTLEGIIRYDGPAPDSVEHQIVMRGDDRPQLDPWCLYVTPDGHLLFHIEDQDSRRAELLSPEPIPLGRVISVGGTLDDGTGQMRLYVDRKLVGSAVTSIRPMASLDRGETPGIGIGNVQSANYKEAFNGMIFEVRVSNCCRGAEELLKVERNKERVARG
jgi:hypothetical protein